MKRTLALGLLLAGLAFAVDYRVDPTGGPLTLEERVAAAFATWGAIEGANVAANVTEEATNVVRYGDGTRFGPDLRSLTVQRSEGRAQTLLVLLNPTAVTERVLLHETGLLLGLSPGVSGVMNPRLGEAVPTLTEADTRAVTDLGLFIPEDINRDGVVDFYDLALLAASFGQRGVNLQADINRDGVVDERDLARLREAYVFAAPAESPPQPGVRAPAAPIPDLPPAAGEDATEDDPLEDDTTEDETLEDDTTEDEEAPTPPVTPPAQPPRPRNP